MDNQNLIALSLMDMSAENLPTKDTTMGVRLEPAFQTLWKRLSEKRFKKPQSSLAREVLFEFMASYFSDDELAAVGLINPHTGYLSGAITAAQTKRERVLDERLRAHRRPPKTGTD